MSAKSKLLLMGLLALCFIAACSASGCAAHSSLNGRETWGIGLFQMREGKGDTSYTMGDPAVNESSQSHLRASEADAPSASIQAMFAQKGGR